MYSQAANVEPLTMEELTDEEREALARVMSLFQSLNRVGR